MKKKTLIIVILALCFSGLFWEQMPGLNFSLFTLLFTIGLLTASPGKIADRRWLIFAVAANVCAFSVFLVASALSVFAALVALIALAGITGAPGRSLLLSGVYAGFSIMTSPFNIIKQGTGFLRSDSGGSGNKKTLMAIMIALGAAVPFLLLYMASNPLFARMVTRFDLQGIDLGWCVFTVFSFLFVYGLLMSRSFQWIEHLEGQYMRDVQEESGETHHQDNIALVGVIFFGLLNVMLLLMNGLDVNQLYISKTLPEGITLSEFVHEAITATILSIALAVCFICLLFKGELNFIPKGRAVKMLTYVWMIQTGIVVINSMVRNQWYISEFHLTELRIGVYGFLVLSLAGLVLTWVKISRKKSAWWLVTSNSSVWFIALVLSSLIDWNRLITTYNISNAAIGAKPDIDYLLSLGGNLDQMVELRKKADFTEEQDKRLRERINQNRRRIEELQWPGHSMRMERNKQAVLQFDLHK